MNLHPKRQCKCTEHRGDEPWHGRAAGYTYHYCRCGECASYVRPYVTAYNRRNRLAARARSRAHYRRNRRVAPNLRPQARWTPAEDAVALDPTLTRVQAATILGRSVDALKHRLCELRKSESVGPRVITIKAPGFDGPWILIHAKDLAEAERIIDTLTPNITKSLV